MTTQLQLDQRCEKDALTKSGCDCLSTSRTYFHGKARTAARASYLFRPSACSLLLHGRHLAWLRWFRKNNVGQQQDNGFARRAIT